MGPGRSVVARVLENPRLRRLELAFVLFSLGEYGVWLAVTVYAFQHGGTTRAALIATLQLLPAAAVAPVLARITDQRGGLHMLLTGYVVQAVSVAGTAVAMLDHAPAWLVYTGAVVAASAVTATRPAQASALGTQVEHPEELTAANVLNGWADSGALLGGPALAGLLIGIDGSGLALAGFGAGLVLSACLVAPAALASPASPPLQHLTEETRSESIEPEASDRRPGWLAALASGPVLAVLGVMAAQYMALGALDVLVVVLAVHTLGLGASFAGYIDAAFGIGSVVGAAAAVWLVGAASLTGPLCIATLSWALSYALLGSFPALATALGLLAVAGVSHAVVDTAGRALLARVTPLSRLGRVFGMLEGMNTAALAVGALLVPLFFNLGGVRLALIAIAVLLVAAVILPLSAVRAADRSAPAMDGVRRLYGHPLFSRLTLPSLEELARDLVIFRVAPGTDVVTQGEPGDTFYLIADGEFEVTVHGRAVRRLEPGEGFGEIALLHHVPRTATVTACTSSTLYAVGRRSFLGAMGTNPPQVSLPGHADLGGNDGLDADPEASGTVPA